MPAALAQAEPRGRGGAAVCPARAGPRGHQETLPRPTQGALLQPSAKREPRRHNTVVLWSVSVSGVLWSVSGVLWSVSGVLWSVSGVLWSVFVVWSGVLWSVSGVLWSVSGVLWSVSGVLWSVFVVWSGVLWSVFVVWSGVLWSVSGAYMVWSVSGAYMVWCALVCVWCALVWCALVWCALVWCALVCVCGLCLWSSCVWCVLWSALVCLGEHACHVYVHVHVHAPYIIVRPTEVTTGIRNPRALGCSFPSTARALLRARGFQNPIVTEVATSNLFGM